MWLSFLVLPTESCFCDMDLLESIAEAVSSKLICNAWIMLGSAATGSVSSVMISLYLKGPK